MLTGMLHEMGEDSAPGILRRLLENAADQCSWETVDFEQLCAGTLPRRTVEQRASQSVALVLNGFPNIRETLVEVLKTYGTERLASSAHTTLLPRVE